MKPQKKPTCPNCESKTVLFRKGTQTFWCRRCGHEWDKK